jgi:hypothetical protein
MNANTDLESIPTHAGSTPEWNDELAGALLTPPQVWREPGYDAVHHAKAGLLVGGIAGCTSLVLNVIGSVLWPAITGQEQHALRLIQVYLTFPLGESALQLHSGTLLALGCVLYLVTGMLYGVVFTLAISYLLPRADLRARLMACSVLSLILWVVNFYLLLSWLQPLLFGGRWIAELIPWWVAMITHLVFGWTVAALYPVDTTIREKPASRLE